MRMRSVASSDVFPITAPSGAEYAAGGVVRILCTVRLLVLVLGAVDALLTRDLSIAWVVLCAAPFSFVPALNWNTRGPRYFTNGILLAADVVVTAFVLLMIAGTPLMAAYGAATVALWGTASGLRIALLMSVPVVLLLLPWGSLGDGWRGPVFGLVVACGVGGMAWAGSSLGTSLRRQRRMAAELAAELERQAAARERLRIARDLHDTVAGDVAGITLLARGVMLQSASEPLSAPTSELLRALMEAAQTAHTHTRQALSHLRSASADLSEEVRSIAARWQARTGIVVDVEISEPIDDIDAEVVADAVAVLHELLENVRKHAEATRVSVSLKTTDGPQLWLVVTDDGRGMPAHSAQEGHYGVLGVNERAALRGGDARWSSMPSGGTQVSVHMATGVPADGAEA